MFASFAPTPALPVVGRVPLAFGVSKIDLVHHHQNRRHLQVRLVVEPGLEPVEQIDVRLAAGGGRGRDEQDQVGVAGRFHRGGEILVVDPSSP